MKMEKKYIIISIVSVLILVIGFSTAFFTSRIVGEGKQILIRTKELNIIFKDETEIKPKESVDPGWNITKTFSVESRIKGSYYYSIVIEDLVNTIESGTLVYKITSENGYNMSDYMPLPISKEEKTISLTNYIEIPEGELQEYKIELKYLKTEEIDQTDDAEKTFSGRLGIVKGEKKTLAEKILEDNELKGTRTNFEDAMPYIEYDEDTGEYGEYDETNDTESGLYVENNTLFTEDTNKDGIGEEVYYFAGNVKNNWVKFANYYWRIIRINEDGGIRLIYSGVNPESLKPIIGHREINIYNDISENHGDPIYLGFKYGTEGSLENNRLNTHNSTILGNDEGTDEGSLNWWYKNKILDLGFADYVSKTAIYCNDRAIASGYVYSTKDDFDNISSDRNWGGTENIRPSYKCGVDINGNVINKDENGNDLQSIEDKFSADISSGGNGDLKYPIGMITTDEAIYASGKLRLDNMSFSYLFRNNKGRLLSAYFWSMTPGGFSTGGNSSFYDMFADGYLTGGTVEAKADVRPVISIKSCAIVNSGNGTWDNPYTFSIDDKCASAVN